MEAGLFIVKSLEFATKNRIIDFPLNTCKQPLPDIRP